MVFAYEDVSGVVTNEVNGAPLANIRIAYISSNAPNHVSYKTTDLSGYYEIIGLGCATWTIYLDSKSVVNATPVSKIIIVDKHCNFGDPTVSSTTNFTARRIDDIAIHHLMLY